MLDYLTRKLFPFQNQQNPNNQYEKKNIFSNSQCPWTYDLDR